MYRSCTSRSCFIPESMTSTALLLCSRLCCYTICPAAAVRRHLRLPRRRQEPQRQAAPAVRVRAHVHAGRAGALPGLRSSLCYVLLCVTAVAGVQLCCVQAPMCMLAEQAGWAAQRLKPEKSPRQQSPATHQPWLLLQAGGLGSTGKGRLLDMVFASCITQQTLTSRPRILFHLQAGGLGST